MIWASLAILSLVVIVLIVTLFLCLQSVSQTLANSILTLERVHTSDGKRIDSVLDRLMAMDFESFKNYQRAENAEEGGMELPEEEAYVRLETPGAPEGLGVRGLQAAAEERRILMEDFPEEAEARS